MKKKRLGFYGFMGLIIINVSLPKCLSYEVEHYGDLISERDSTDPDRAENQSADLTKDIGLAKIDPYFAEPASELQKFFERFEVDRNALFRYWDIPQNPITYFYSYNKPLTQRCMEDLEKYFVQWQNNLNGIDFEALRPETRIEYLLFKKLLDRELLRLDRSKQLINKLNLILPFAQKMIDLEEKWRQRIHIKPENIAKWLEEIYQDIDDTKRKLLSNELKTTPVMLRRAREALLGLGKSLDMWFRFFYGYDPQFSWWVKEPYMKVERSIQDYIEFLGNHAATPDIIGDPIGKEALLEELDFEMIPYTPDELVAIGMKELEICEIELKKSARELGFEDDWKRALDHVKTAHMEPGEQWRYVHMQAIEAIEFVNSLNLITVPELAKNIWRMEMTPPERQKINPFITGGEVLRISYPTFDMPHEDKTMIMRGNNIHTTRAIVHHELIPGHHLQGFMNSRYRAYRGNLFRTDFWREGWALYWEILLYELGFPRTPEEKIGMLFWRMHRCARIVFTIKYHLGQISPQDAIEFLVERIGHEPLTAEGEVRRPLERDRPIQPLSYMIGALQYKALRRELVDSHRFTDRQFHDKILQNNYMPVEMLREIMQKNKVNKDFKSSWRFYEYDF